MNQQFVADKVEMSSAVESSVAIVVAEMIDPGTLDLGPPGQALHANAKIKVVSCLAGTISGEQTVTFFSQRSPEATAEGVPVKGEKYVFFLQQLSPRSLHAVKVLPATPQNIEQVRQLKRKR